MKRNRGWTLVGIIAMTMSLLIINQRVSGATPNTSLIPHTAQQTIIVTTTTDDFTSNGNCSLREAVYAANHDMPVDACAAGTTDDTVSLPAGIFTLTRIGSTEDSGLTGDLDITGTLHLTGATSATTIIDGNQTDRILDIFSGNVSTHNMTLRNGKIFGPNESTGGAVQIRAGSFDAQQAIFHANRAADDPSDNVQFNTYGGAIYNSTGVLTLTNTIFSLNQADSAYFVNAGFGGAIFNGASAKTNISSSVIKDTVAQYSSNTLYNVGELHMHNSVFMHNPTPLWNTGNAIIVASQFLNNTTPTIINRGTPLLDSTLVINDSEIAFNQTPSERFYCVTGGGVATSSFAHTIINRSFIHDNVTEYGAGVYAGDLYNPSSTFITNSAIVNNHAVNISRGRDECNGSGAGVFADGGLLRIENTTIANNWAEYTAGGILVSNPTNQPTVFITNTSVISNYNAFHHIVIPDEALNPNYNVGGIYAKKPITLTNTLVATNTSRLLPEGSDCLGTINSGGYNLIQNPTALCVVTGMLIGNIVHVDPQLGTLADHGGSTLTYDLLPSSPAIDAGSPTICPATDQRGVSRPQDGDGANGARCDIGAYEYVRQLEKFIKIYFPLVFK